MKNVLICEGPDSCGKTEIGIALAKKLSMEYFRMPTQHENWRAGKFKEALELDQPFLIELLRQTKLDDLVIDRAWPSEFVYSQVFDRDTNWQALEEIDREHSDLGTTIVLLLRSTYVGSREDELVPQQKLQALHDQYLDFMDWTKCDVIAMLVDKYGNDCKQQVPRLIDAITHARTQSERRKKIIWLTGGSELVVR